MNKQIPNKKEYSLPLLIQYLVCTNGSCPYNGVNVRQLRISLRKKYDGKYAYLCPECFKKLILKKDKEKVSFT